MKILNKKVGFGEAVVEGILIGGGNPCQAYPMPSVAWFIGVFDVVCQSGLIFKYRKII